MELVIKMKVYISGRITGNDNYKHDFKRRARELKYLGYHPVNPVNIYKQLKKELGREPTRDEIMDADIAKLKTCDAINFLTGWEYSDGAKHEYAIAVENHKTILKIYILSRDW